MSEATQEERDRKDGTENLPKIPLMFTVIALTWMNQEYSIDNLRSLDQRDHTLQ